MQPAACPCLFQVNTRAWLTQLSRQQQRHATLDDIPDSELAALAARGFDWLWLLGVWQTGLAGQTLARSDARWRREFQEILPDLRDTDIAGSCFAITDYSVAASLGGAAALERLRGRLARRGLRLMLDFVPNHVALDHLWTEQHPGFFVAGTEADLDRSPQSYCRIPCCGQARILAHGRDPYFPAWADTLQLNYGNPALQEAMIGELRRVASQCDGVRCDMAMLVLPEVIERTWGLRSAPFWPTAIARVRQEHPQFLFLAEVYWDLERTLQEQGFDYCYDKRLYDRLREGRARPVRDHFRVGLDYQLKLARFLENHDEARAAATYAPGQHEAAAAITYLSPGLRFFHQGQLEGHLKRIPPHLLRAPAEAVNPALRDFYARLLQTLRQPALRQGAWQLLECAPASPENPTWDDCLAWTWAGPEERRLLIAVNYAAHPSQCLVPWPFDESGSGRSRLRDLWGPTDREHKLIAFQSRGLFLHLSAWQCQVFEVGRPG